jgi:hypothetical protein
VLVCISGSAATLETVERLTDELVDSAHGGAHHPWAMSTERYRPLRPGDTVEVRPPAEILAAVDADGALESVPFMPEMLQFVGHRFTVFKRVEKICDTVAGTGSRRMHNTVFLDDLRCDGSGHGGCQAGCRIYWKEAWLKRVDADGSLTKDDRASGDSMTRLEQLSHAHASSMRERDDATVEAYRCQATEAFASTTPLNLYEPGQYWREIVSGNVGLIRFVRVAARALTQRVGHKLGVMSHLPLEPRGDSGAPSSPLGLQPGDWVQVKSPDEIALTLDKQGRNRGLWFDTEMLPYCGGTFLVKDRVRRFINESTGEMIELKSDAVILEGVVCSGDRSAQRWFCPRAIYPYWREAWLRRVDVPSAAAAKSGAR